MSEAEVTPDGEGKPSDDELVGEVVEDDAEEATPKVSGEDTGLISLAGEMPANVIVVPLDETVLFPGMTIPVIYPPGPIREAVEFAAAQGPFVAFVPRKTPREGGASPAGRAVQPTIWRGDVLGSSSR